jgi:hypothetical protein
MQIKAIFWGPLQIAYYFFRGIVFILLIPYNLAVFTLDLLYIPWVMFMWFIYFLKAVLWWMDVAYVMSKFWIMDPPGFILSFFDVWSMGYLFWEVLFWWFWVPMYYLIFLYAWFWEDTFESRPT